MARGRRHQNATERWEREGRDLLLSDPEAVTHGLYCAGCGLQDQTHTALALVGWTEADYLEAIAAAARLAESLHG
jgi:hypothetical protein